MKHYTISTRVDGHLVEKQSIDDPFITTTITIGWPKLLLAALRRRELKVVVKVDGDRHALAHVMRPIEQIPAGGHSTAVKGGVAQ